MAVLWMNEEKVEVNNSVMSHSLLDIAEKSWNKSATVSDTVAEKSWNKSATVSDTVADINVTI